MDRSPIESQIAFSQTVSASLSYNVSDSRHTAVFRTVPSGLLLEDRTRVTCPNTEAVASNWTVAPQSGSSRLPHFWTSARHDFSFEVIDSEHSWQEPSPLSHGADELLGPAVRENGLAHLSGAFSAVNIGNQLKVKPFRKAGVFRRKHTPADQIQSPYSPRSSPLVVSEPTQAAQAKELSQHHGHHDANAKGSKRAKRRGGVVEQLMCGAFAGVVSRTATAPIDLVRTHLISSHALEGASKTPLGVLQGIVKKDGLIGLFRGNGINCLRVAPCKAIELCTFQMLKGILGSPGHPLHRVAAPLSGGAAGLAGTIATYPLEVMRTRISVQPERYTSLASTFQTMVREEGFLSIYKGLPMTLFGVFPYAAANYCVYDTLRGLYRKATGKEKVPTEATLLFGAISASVSSAVTFPLEVARRRIQLGAIGGRVVPSSGVQIIKEIVQRDGWRAVYRGLGTTWLKLIPAAGISFVCYEAARYALGVDDASVAAAKSEQCSLQRVLNTASQASSMKEERWATMPGIEERTSAESSSFQEGLGGKVHSLSSLKASEGPSMVVGLGAAKTLQRRLKSEFPPRQDVIQRGVIVSSETSIPATSAETPATLGLLEVDGGFLEPIQGMQVTKLPRQEGWTGSEAMDFPPLPLSYEFGSGTVTEKGRE